MRTSALHRAALLVAALWVLPADAEPPSGALRLYAAGNYLAAADAANDRTSSESLAFAARALLTACVAADPDAPIGALLDRAERYARQALALDPGSVDARLQLALVYGMRGQRASLPGAFARNYAPRGRRLIDQALALAPGDARAYALLGAWHLEILRRGGGAGALVYGADFDEGAAAFERAMHLAPDDPLAPLHYALALIHLDATANAEHAAALLAIATALPPRDAFESHAQQIGAALAETLAQQGPRAAERAARSVRL
jgi:tetratricopeptide (TPR) repeat protein